MLCPECGEVTAPGPLDARRPAADPVKFAAQLQRLGSLMTKRGKPPVSST